MTLWGLLVLVTSCTKEPGADPSRRPDATYNPELHAVQFLPDGQLNNQFLRHLPGKTYVYTGPGEEGDEHIEVTKAAETITILDISCTIIVEKIWVNDHLIEQEDIYYAEQMDGDVWQIGVAVKNYNTSGAVINDHTSWMSGLDGAKPGLVMPGDPQIGIRYRQEYYFNVAENQAEVVDTGITVTTAMGTFYDCIVIREWSELEPDILDIKMYAPSVGLIREVNLSTGNEIELVDIR